MCGEVMILGFKVHNPEDVKLLEDTVQAVLARIEENSTTQY